MDDVLYACKVNVPLGINIIGVTALDSFKCVWRGQGQLFCPETNINSYVISFLIRSLNYYLCMCRYIENSATEQVVQN